MKSTTTGAARRLSTTIGIKLTTKAKLDRNRAPGQCYDGFVCQLVDLWEKTNERRISYIEGPAGETRVLRSKIDNQLK